MKKVISMTKAAATLLFSLARGNFLCVSLSNPRPSALFALQIWTFLRASIECFLAWPGLSLAFIAFEPRQIHPNEGQSQDCGDSSLI